MATKILVVLIIIAVVGIVSCLSMLKHELDNAIEIPEDIDLFDEFQNEDEHVLIEVMMNEGKQNKRN